MPAGKWSLLTADETIAYFPLYYLIIFRLAEESLGGRSREAVAQSPHLGCRPCPSLVDSGCEQDWHFGDPHLLRYQLQVDVCAGEESPMHDWQSKFKAAIDKAFSNQFDIEEHEAQVARETEAYWDIARKTLEEKIQPVVKDATDIVSGRLNESDGGRALYWSYTDEREPRIHLRLPHPNASSGLELEIFATVSQRGVEFGMRDLARQGATLRFPSKVADLTEESIGEALLEAYSESLLRFRTVAPVNT